MYNYKSDAIRCTLAQEKIAIPTNSAVFQNVKSGYFIRLVGD